MSELDLKGKDEPSAAGNGISIGKLEEALTGLFRLSAGLLYTLAGITLRPLRFFKGKDWLKPDTRLLQPRSFLVGTTVLVILSWGTLLPLIEHEGGPLEQILGPAAKAVADVPQYLLVVALIPVVLIMLGAATLARWALPKTKRSVSCEVKSAVFYLAGAEYAWLVILSFILHWCRAPLSRLDANRVLSMAFGAFGMISQPSHGYSIKSVGSTV